MVDLGCVLPLSFTWVSAVINSCCVDWLCCLYFGFTYFTCLRWGFEFQLVVLVCLQIVWVA